MESVAERAEGQLEGVIAALTRALAELGEAQSETERVIEAMDLDPYALELTEERLFAIRALARKHSVASDDLPDLAQDLRTRLSMIEGGDRELDALKADVAAARTRYDTLAADLRKAREAAAGRLDKAMASELAPLKLERAIFRTLVEAAEPGPEGADHVAFTVATNPGAPSGPIDKIASGGELSRFLLALKVCLTSRSSGLTMIFDEIDRGVGGATADAVGRRLSQIAAGAQVLVVTHSAQVAALGQHHFRVTKAVTGAMTRTDVAALDAEERIGEIARMLAGDRVTQEARAAARALLPG